MDFRKLKAAAIGGAAVVLAVAFGAGQFDDEDAVGSYRGGYYRTAGASFASAGNNEVVTRRVWSRVTNFPNFGAMTAGYITATDTVGATINSGNAGEAVRWGFVSKATPTVVNYDAGSGDYYISTTAGVGEDDYTWNPTTLLGFIWVSANGLENGDKIKSAFLLFNTYSWGGFTVNAGGYYAARLDTISNDYKILNGTVGDYGSGDVARFDATWNECDATGNVNWSPTLDSRTDRHDFGPMSDTVIGPGTYAAKTALRLDVTDAVQQASDNGTLGRGLLFVLYGNAGVLTSPAIGAGVLASNVGRGANGSKGCPGFIATAESRRGPRPWAGITPVPVAAIYDDQYPVQSSYFTAMESGGMRFDAAVFRDGVNNYSWVDSVYSLKGSLFGLIHHSRTHPSLGGLTADQLAPQLSRKWFPEEFTGFAAADTVDILDTAWPGGGSSPAKSVLAISEMVNFGYRSARGYGGVWDEPSKGAEYETRLSWDGWFNAYNVRAAGLSSVMNAADMADEIGDLVDEAYTNYGRSALILYGHRNTSSPADGITPARLAQMIAITNASNACQILPYSEIVGMRLSGAPFVSPQVASASARLSGMADSVAIRKAAAIQDSIYRADADPNLLEVWIGPK